MSEPYSSAGSSAGGGTTVGGPGYQGPASPSGFGPPALMSPSDQRTWSMVAHLAHLAGSVVGVPAVGPLVVYLIVKDRGPFARRQAAEALNFQILLLAVYLGAAVLSVLTLGIGVILLAPLAGLAALVGLVFTIIAAVRSYQGIDYRYPLSWRLVR